MSTQVPAAPLPVAPTVDDAVPKVRTFRHRKLLGRVGINLLGLLVLSLIHI